jgi:hypothetical protein
VGWCNEVEKVVGWPSLYPKKKKKRVLLNLEQTIQSIQRAASEINAHIPLFPQ